MAKTKTLIAALALAGASLGAPVASAADISGTPQTITLTDNAGFFGDAFGMNNNGNTFTDVFQFTAVAGANLDAIVASSSHGANDGLNISAFDIYRGSGGGGGGGAGGTLVAHGTQLESGATDVWTLTANNLTAGDYWLRVSGTMNSNGSAVFGGALAMAAPVIPEPGTYAMLLGGLGVVSLMARRRKS